MEYHITELRKKLKETKDTGYIPSIYTHHGGIGNTLEQLLGIRENNIALPDLGSLELKCRRKETGSLITLFTKSPNRYSNAQLLQGFGYDRGDGHLVIHQTVYFGKKNAQGYHLQRSDTELECWNNDRLLGTYSLEFLETKFLEKIGDGVVLVLGRTRRNQNDLEEFHYCEAYLLKGLIFEALLANLRYDIRIGRYPDGRVHDHGSAFRVRYADLARIFETYERIL